MKKIKTEEPEKLGKDTPLVPTIGRRDLMKMGVGAGVMAAQMLHAPSAFAQEGKPPAQKVYGPPPPRVKPVPGGPPYITPHEPQHRVCKYGDFMNTSGRLYGNGPMDETTRKIVSYASSFTVDLSDDKLVADIGNMLEDTLGCAISAFETDSIRTGVRVAQWQPGGKFKSTIWGYGVTTTPEMAAYVNCCMIRHFDNNSAGQHETDMVAGILAMGEALHCSGTEVLSALVLFWEVFSALLAAQYAPGAPGDAGVNRMIDNHTHAAALAVTVSKMMGLDEDRMANALSLAVVDSIPLYINHWETVNSMSKSNHDAVQCRQAIFAALRAKAGTTGPCQPYEGAKGLMDVVSGRFELKIPARIGNTAGGDPGVPFADDDHRRIIQTIAYKRWPVNGYGQQLYSTIPEVRNFCSVEEIESIDMEVGAWGDGSGPWKMDPLNSETADHSTSYCYSRLLLDGELSPASYEKEKLADPKVRALMAKITEREESGNRITVRTKSGKEKVFIAGQWTSENLSWQLQSTTLPEMHKKFDRNCAYRGVTDAQRDRIRKTWSDLRKVKDISVAIQETLATIGKIKPVDDSLA